jgi:hypothetical protein
MSLGAVLVGRTAQAFSSGEACVSLSTCLLLCLSPRHSHNKICTQAMRWRSRSVDLMLSMQDLGKVKRGEAEQESSSCELAADLLFVWAHDGNWALMGAVSSLCFGFFCWIMAQMNEYVTFSLYHYANVRLSLYFGFPWR